MTTLDKKTIQNLTKLSRISCSEKEQADLLTDLQKILSYIEQLNEVDTEGVPPCNHVIANIANVMREDKVGELMPRKLFLENAPSEIGGMVRVPPVLKSN